ncbi:hypothetical protein HCN44_008960 [Aphidius gifuensis]|uniref:Cytochrome c oxidase subunit 5A, mitochondrial n=1 Tax=Aphidius gifuensis TaxID=684658 RepID=A0A835CP82_APHGI|nr:cytochrome c oxidase subunit 5A, mitochondrial [Aphidius gifuensis]KAF7991589.1 hypothetical protein HCN44_008960 [Aphidius gifuensis]
MLRFVAGRVNNIVRSAIVPRTATTTTPSSSVLVSQVRNSSHDVEESDEAFDARYEAYFNRSDIDSWEVRKAMNDLAGRDLVPEPKIIIAALKACRRLNDFALAIRFLETCKFKTGNYTDKIWPYLVQEIRPTLDELGINTPEELGYDKPELALVPAYEIH